MPSSTVAECIRASAAGRYPKLDRRFVASLDDPVAQAITTAVIDLAPALGLACLAEGVETAEQLATLTRLGCPYAQGHHIAVPRPADEVTAQLAARGARAAR